MTFLTLKCHLPMETKKSFLGVDAMWILAIDPGGGSPAPTTHSKMHLYSKDIPRSPKASAYGERLFSP